LRIGGENEFVERRSYRRPLPPPGAEVLPPDAGVVELINAWRERNLNALDYCFDGLAVQSCRIRTGVEEFIVFEGSIGQTVNVGGMPSGMHSAEAIEFEEDRQALEPRHPHSVPFAGDILVVGKVVEPAFVHHPVLIIVATQPLPVTSWVW
jgi:hypothetical protein